MSVRVFVRRVVGYLTAILYFVAGLFARWPAANAQTQTAVEAWNFYFVTSNLAQGEALSLEEIKARNGVLLSEEELQKVIPGAKVINRPRNGDTRLWTNNLNGKLVASTDARGGTNLGGQRPSYAEGSWRIENGAYCVQLQWRRTGEAREEHWCRHMYKLGDKYYGVPIHRENAPAMEFQISK